MAGMAAWRGAGPGRGRGHKRTRFPRVEDGEETVKGKILGTQDQGLWSGKSMEDGARPLPRFGTHISPTAAEEDCPASLKPHPTSFLSPEAQTRASTSSHITSQTLPAGVCPSPVPHCPSICASTQLTSFSPQPVQGGLSRLVSFSQAARRRGQGREGGGRLRGEGQVMPRRGDTGGAGWADRHR